MRPSKKRRSRKETGRIEAFSDGVFAVAITLLVFNLKVPQIAAGDTHAVRDLGSSFVLSMAFVSCVCYQFCNNLDHVGKPS